MDTHTNHDEETTTNAEENGTFWEGNHRLEALRERVSELVPTMGAVEDTNSPKLERLRLVTNAYWDLFNNGGWNPGRKTSYYFPGAMTAFHGAINKNLDQEASMAATYAITEPIMSKAVFAAALEQGLLG